MKKLMALLGTITVAVGLAGCSINQQGTQEQKSTKTNQITASELPTLNYQNGKQAYVEVNNGHSTLDANAWKRNHIEYANLDRHNRTAAATTAYLEKRNLASSSLRSRQTVYPTGWHQKFVNKTAIVNRGHLIAYSLSKGIDVDGNYDAKIQGGDQNNLKNLFTQSAFSNQKVQTIYELLVRSALKDNKKIIYQVQPIFRGDELMARGVHLQAISTDKKLDFNVYLFNVQPGIQFDYATGRSKIDHTLNVPMPDNAPYYSSSRHVGAAAGAAGAYGAYRIYKNNQDRSKQREYREEQRKAQSYYKHRSSTTRYHR